MCYLFMMCTHYTYYNVMFVALTSFINVLCFFFGTQFLSFLATLCLKVNAPTKTIHTENVCSKHNVYAFSIWKQQYKWKFRKVFHLIGGKNAKVVQFNRILLNRLFYSFSATKRIIYRRTYREREFTKTSDRKLWCKHEKQINSIRGWFTIS